MSKAARAIIIEDGNILVMNRNKYGSEYTTLVGGRINDNESLEEGLTREVREETGLTVTSTRLVFIEEHHAPYNEQYIYLCEIGPHDPIAVQATSEEGIMNKMDMNVHTPVWANVNSFSKVSFRTPQLQAAIVNGLKNGFPDEPIKL
jgi:ADP-ribose pyrophosphatase YjhB (NUDIX family)